ncbi:hypothetical protein M8009_18440 [Halomonas sp. ATCH28]|uniref:Uncharacterized protein n=1 Tax=Halomonas gemina TaxID=2945105 RepID=A0ABT0T6W3_9GAMM|nr:hypothetical protein [Halomonas gemina]MCL7942261.1 hypothetical protein [Halomonas gemina]
MKSQNNKAVCEFLTQNLSRDLVEGLSILSTMKVPIHDKNSFEVELKEHSADDKSKKQLIQMFTPQDFPLFSTQSAFEKYFVKFQPFPVPFPSLPLPDIDLPDFTFRPSACDVYARTFGRFAADCACRVYAEAIREGFNSLQATLIGHFAGRRAERSGRCEI